MIKDFIENKRLTRRQFLKSLSGAFLFLTSFKFLEKISYAKAEASNGRPKKNIKGAHNLAATRPSTLRVCQFHHPLARLTLSMKNLMGVCGGNRGKIHVDIGENLVDITDFIYPDLNVIDATRVLLRNGPIGGNLDDVKQVNKVIVSTDPTLADTYACTLVDVEPSAVPNIKVAIKRGFGNADLTKANIKSITT